MLADPIPIVDGSSVDLGLKCYVRGGASVASKFNSTDILTAFLFQFGMPTSVLTPAIGWLTTSDLGVTQTGYDQGQVEASLTSTQVTTLTPAVLYMLIVRRALVGNPTNTEVIVRVPIVIEPLSGP